MPDNRQAGGHFFQLIVCVVAFPVLALPVFRVVRVAFDVQLPAWVYFLEMAHYLNCPVYALAGPGEEAEQPYFLFLVRVESKMAGVYCIGQVECLNVRVLKEELLFNFLVDEPGGINFVPGYVMNPAFSYLVVMDPDNQFFSLVIECEALGSEVVSPLENNGFVILGSIGSPNFVIGNKQAGGGFKPAD